MNIAIRPVRAANRLQRQVPWTACLQVAEASLSAVQSDRRFARIGLATPFMADTRR